MLTIEKNIPIPEAARGRPKGKTKHGFENMDVGDSVFFDGYTSVQNASPYQSAALYGKKYGKKFSGRILDGGLRIWRIA